MNRYQVVGMKTIESKKKPGNFYIILTILNPAYNSADGFEAVDKFISKKSPIANNLNGLGLYDINCDLKGNITQLKKAA